MLQDTQLQYRRFQNALACRLNRRRATHSPGTHTHCSFTNTSTALLLCVLEHGVRISSWIAFHIWYDIMILALDSSRWITSSLSNRNVQLVIHRYVVSRREAPPHLPTRHMVLVIVYALFASSTQLSTGQMAKMYGFTSLAAPIRCVRPVATTAILTASALTRLGAKPLTEEYIDSAVQLSIASGLLYIAMVHLHDFLHSPLYFLFRR